MIRRYFRGLTNANVFPTDANLLSMIGPGDILPHAAKKYGDRTALITATRSLSFRELDDLSTQVAVALRTRGVKPGDVVSLFSQNRWEWVVSYHGVHKAGGIVNPVNVMLTPDELSFVLSNSGAVALMASAEKLNSVSSLALGSGDLAHVHTVISFDSVDEKDASGRALDFATLLQEAATEATAFVRWKPARRDVCTIGYTSGTTGHPKGAQQSQEAVLLNCALTATMHGRNERDVVLSSLPAPHVYGNVVINGTLLAGGQVVLLERFSPASSFEMIAKYQVTLFEGVPAMYAAMLADPAIETADLRSLDRCTVGGQTIPVPILERWIARTGAPVLELWGMTEIAGLGTTHAVHATPVPGSIGVSLPGIEVKILDLENPGAPGQRNSAKTGVSGELLVRGPIVMNGYHNNPTATAEAIEPDGWLHTGDLAYVDETGHVFVVDRIKDMIITGGYNIYPAEIERVLVEHPSVASVAVGPIPDDIKGELACAYVILRPGASATEAEIIEFSATKLAAYKRPRKVRFVADFPKTSSGKIMRRMLSKIPE